MELPTWPNLDAAIILAANAHAGQTRKYTGLPYITHPLEVMQILAAYVPVVSEEELMAAVLHDVLEDTLVDYAELLDKFGATTADLVVELTEGAWTGNRPQRKAKELERLSKISREAQNIKLADLISNTKDIVKNDPGFARVYLPEKRDILKVLELANDDLRLIAARSVTRGFAMLSLNELLEHSDV